MAAAHRFVMVAGGFGTTLVTGHLGPAGALAQHQLDRAVEAHGSIQDRRDFGCGQLAGAVVVGAEGALLAAEGGTFEVATLGVATPVAIPLTVVGATQMAVAASQAAGAAALMVSGASGGATPSKEAATESVAGTSGTTGVQTRANGFKSGELEAHHAKHAAEWQPPPTRQQYLARARQLLNEPATDNILGHQRSNGDIMRYNKTTNDFAVMRSDGTIRTLFRPTNGLDYWTQVTK